MTHNIIKTENYLLVVDDSEIKQNDFFYGVADGSIKPFIEIADENTVKIVTWQLNVIGKSPNKKIAAHLPLNNSPVLEGIDLLPPLENEVEKLAKKHLDSLHNNEDIAHPELYDAYHSFKAGYNTAKKRYKYTEEDLRKAMSSIIEWVVLKNPNDFVDVNDKINETIQSLQQPKMPVAFECLTFDTGNDELDGTHILGIRTTTNPKGQTVLVGKYIY